MREPRLSVRTLSLSPWVCSWASCLCRCLCSLSKVSSWCWLLLSVSSSFWKGWNAEELRQWMCESPVIYRCIRAEGMTNKYVTNTTGCAVCTVWYTLLFQLLPNRCCHSRSRLLWSFLMQPFLFIQGSTRWPLRSVDDRSTSWVMASPVICSQC